VPIMVGLWTARPDADSRPELMQALSADLLAASLGQAVREIAESVGPPRPEVAPAA